MLRSSLSLLVWAYAAASCSSCSTYSDITPTVHSGGTFTAGTDDDCAAGCAQARKLHCPAGDPTPAGASCEAVCHNTETSGYATENPRCMAQAQDCGALDACSNAP